MAFKTTKTEEPKQEAKNLPKQTFRAGAIQAAIWEKNYSVEGKEVTSYDVSLSRGYKDKEGKWQNTPSMRKQDLPAAILVLQKAYETLALADIEE